MYQKERKVKVGDLIKDVRGGRPSGEVMGIIVEILEKKNVWVVVDFMNGRRNTIHEECAEVVKCK
jgi:hypothetical protein